MQRLTRLRLLFAQATSLSCGAASRRRSACSRISTARATTAAACGWTRRPLSASARRRHTLRAVRGGLRVHVALLAALDRSTSITVHDYMVYGGGRAAAVAPSLKRAQMAHSSASPVSSAAKLDCAALLGPLRACSTPRACGYRRSHLAQRRL
jgi:hypothetical protein